jgi:retron-type reverse transcriptase
LANGSIESRDWGTPQGGVISPLLANLFLHYVFDRWIEKRWGGIQRRRISSIAREGNTGRITR